MKALILNCTLKKSPEPSNSGLLAGEVVSGLEEHGVECETIRLVDLNILPGVLSDEGDGDEWPEPHPRGVERRPATGDPSTGGES